MFVTDPSRDTLTSLRQKRRNTTAPEVEEITTFTCLGTGEKQKYAAEMIWIRHNLL